MLTADIALDDAIMDLIDNAVDAITRLHNHPLDSRLIAGRAPRSPDGTIDIKVTSNEVSISDDGIGMTRKDAETDVFRLGRLAESTGATLGVYGIGMKRALFKIGNTFEVVSRPSKKVGFRAHLPDVEIWKTRDRGRSDWEIPLAAFPRSESALSHGTRIRITNLRAEIKMQMRDESIIVRLRKSIGRTYGLLLDRYVRIRLNGRFVAPIPIPLGSSSEIKRGIKRVALLDGKVTATIVAGLAAKSAQTSDMTEVAGWYVLCNGRVVLAGDKTASSGWGTDGNAIFVPSFRAFIGIVFFFSNTPVLLPWRTTKRGLNSDAATFLAIRPTMWTMAKPILSYLRSYYYSGGDVETTETRRLQDKLQAVDLNTLGNEPESEFATAAKRPKTRKKKDPNIQTIQYPATKNEIARGGRLIGEPGAPGKRVGRVAFDLLLEGEL